MGSDLGDVNNDGLIDFFVADMAATTHQKDQRIDGRRARTDRGAAGQLRRGARSTTGTPSTQHGHGPLPRGRVPRGHRRHRLDLVGAPRGPGQRRAPRPLRHQRHSPRDPNVDVVAAHDARRDPGRAHPDHARRARSWPRRTSPSATWATCGSRTSSAAWGLDQKGVSFGAAFGDLSGDGNLDIVYTNYQGGVTLLRNDCDTGHRVNVDLRGTRVQPLRRRRDRADRKRPRASRSASSSLARGYMSSSEPMLHFGLGEDTTIRRLAVTWPSGHVQAFENLAVDRRYTVTEPSRADRRCPPDAPPAAARSSRR